VLRQEGEDTVDSAKKEAHFPRRVVTEKRGEGGGEAEGKKTNVTLEWGEGGS